jgi:predicted metal-dependent phosphoesterase TrpH
MAEARGIAPFGTDGIWLRCNLHAHTTASDGMLDPFMLRRYYTLGGYDALAITDHDMLTAAPRDEERGQERMALLVPGTEITLRAPVSGGPLHVVALGVRELPDLGDGSLATLAAAVQAQGGVAVVAHPWWSGLLPEELGDLAGVAAIEVYNAGCEIEQGRGNSAQYWDALLARGVRVNALATDDHHLPGFNAFHAWTMVKARERSVGAVLEALREGAFYSSCGPAILNITSEDGHLVVESSPVQSIAAVGQPPYGTRVNAGPHGLAVWGERRMGQAGIREGVVEGDLLTWAAFPPFPGLRYIRIEVIDALGRYAWSNPIWLDA